MCNPLAGSGRASGIGRNIQLILETKNVLHSLFIDKWPVSFYSYSDIWIIGGDGTLNYFINKYPDTTLPLVIFNGGTGNDFHWLLYGSKTIEEQVEIAMYAEPRPIDAGRCNERYFINGVGIGFEGEVAKALTGKKKLSGKTSFLLTILKKIFSYRSKHYEVKTESKNLEGKKLLIDISNGRRAGGGFHIAPVAEANDGLLDVVIANALTPLQRLRYLPVIEKGKHLALPFINHFTSRNIKVTSGAIIQYHLDGEYFEATQLDVEIMSKKFLFRY
ncbi:MAG TPA: YegS/Rv2252/BmrU family lipid kinase [Chitinophagaceae bacterium]|nr:YegS/Rv2252/BmrU family lipid kinase [Chitinophagaceae bacterium]